MKALTKIKYHLIGIGGIGMSAIAFLLLSEGHEVYGSDMKDSDIIKRLKEKGAKIFIGHKEENLKKDIDKVVISSAIPEENPELKRARELKIPVLKRSQILGELMKKKLGIAIAGTHGKTTTTTLISLILERANYDPTILVGGEVKNIGGNFKFGQGLYFISEACEYDRSFLDFNPKIGLITNIEADHLDYYKNLEEIVDAFAEFGAKLPKEGFLVIGLDNPNTRKILDQIKTKKIGYGISSIEGISNPDEYWQVKEIEMGNGKTKFALEGPQHQLFHFTIKLPGIHNVLDATGAFVLAYNLGVDPEVARDVIYEFEGVKRRFEKKGEEKGILVIDDYGHHPTEIQATLFGIRQFYPKRRLICVFEAHQYSRTRFLLEDFAKSFSEADEVIIPEIYAVRDKEEDIKAISGKDLAQAIKKGSCKNTKYIGEYNEIVNYLLKTLKENDLLLTMGAGNIYKVGELILKKLRGGER